MEIFEDFKKKYLDAFKKEADKDGWDSVCVMAPQPGKNSWTYQEVWDSMINNTGIFKDIIVTYYNYFMEKEIEEFKKALHKDSVKFKYRKKNGEEREAFGTLNIDIMGEENAPSGNGKEYPENQIRYFDLVSNGWRSFLSENLISWENG